MPKAKKQVFSKNISNAKAFQSDAKKSSMPLAIKPDLCQAKNSNPEERAKRARIFISLCQKWLELLASIPIQIFFNKLCEIELEF